MIAALTKSLSARWLPDRTLPSMGALSLTHPLVQAAIYAVGLLATKAVSFVMLPFITGYLPPAEFGRLEVMVAIADIASVVLGMGLLDALFRFASASNGTREGRSTNRSAAARIFGLSLLLGVGFGATGLALAPTLTSIFPGASETLHLQLILVTVSLEGAIQIPLAWLRMTDRPVMYLALSVGKAVLQAILTLSFLEMGMGVTGVLLAGTIAAASLGAILVLQQSRATGVSFRLKGAGSILRYSAPLVLSGIAGFLLGGFDRIVLADALGAEAMASYALAAKFALLAGLMLSPLKTCVLKT
ncbi:MAG: oligosaccharide flippase family protein [Pseudomonadota bacterium]